MSDITIPTYVLSKNGKPIMEVTASSVERAQDYFYYEMPEAYHIDYSISPKPIKTPDYSSQ